MKINNSHMLAKNKTKDVEDDMSWDIIEAYFDEFR